MAKKTSTNNAKLARNETKLMALEVGNTPSIPTIGFLLIQIIVGYEWFISGLTKAIRADFVGGLADELGAKSAGMYNWYTEFLNQWVIPNAVVFGYLIEVSEILIGVIFISIALLWLFGAGVLSNKAWRVAFLLTAIAGVGGIFMAINFHIANGLSHPWLIPQDSFEEGVDFDSLLAVMNAIIAIVNAMLFSMLPSEQRQ